MNPEQLSETIVDVLTALVADGTLTLPDGVPTQVTVERPRQKGHGDYATNVAMQLAKKAGTNPRAFAELRRRAAARRRRHRRGRGRRSRASSTSPSRPAPRARSPPTSSRPVRRTARSEVLAGQRINVEFISANPTGPLHLGHTRWAVLGDAIARVLQAAGADGDPRVLHQRPRQPDEPLRRLDRGRRARRADPGRRLPGRLHRRPRRGGRGRAPRRLRPARRTSGCAAVPRGRLRDPARAAAGASSTAFNTHFDVWFSERGLQRRRGSVPDTLRAAARTTATSSRPTARCGCAPPTSATTRTGC